MDGHTAAVRVAGLTKRYGGGDAEVVALDDVDVAFERGRFTAIMGPSGSGKSTLVHCAAGLDRPSAGRVWLGDTELTGLPDDRLTDLRRDRVGFVFQSFNLLPTLNALENITLPLDLAGRSPDQETLDRVIRTLRLADRVRHRPSQLSGGQQQRVACARALVTRPDVVFADEPTGALDSATSGELLRFLRGSVDALGQTLVMVTHDPVAAGYADRVVLLADGRVVDELRAPSPDDVIDRMRALERR
ncbi:ABC transporter ATP-binding protein [Actinokineospora auranticolor]|uniref:Putative ABC transport system ATP-binding protein n=1 Tax=Actinokineospora auranticolor TaxID=155976 RepID=A0A2S6H0W9_9PSEU|nr:ABC transporter ATP-binding protein [Actinokineospora auranticolor]PPK71132.1 putative ABC transport system ATP-binding protein [Actinokineospora auranticolor]